MDVAPVLVAGAGPTGLVLALWLARRGVPVRIIDKASGPGQQSRAMGVHARTLEFYRQLGFAEEVVDAGIKALRLRLREEGEEVASFTLGDVGAGLSPYPFLLCYAQDDHERLLGGKLREAGVEVEWDTALESFTQDEGGVEAVLSRAGQQERVRTPYLCGCDGAHSAVRQGLGIGFPGGDYEQLAYVADAELEGDRNDDVVISLDREGFGLKLPVRSTGMHRLIGLVPRAQSDGRTLTFEDIRPEVERTDGVRVRSVNWFSTYHVHHRVAEHFQVGRVFLAGDAGHIHSPVGAQGMNTGIGDAVNLAWKLAEALSGRMPPSVLESYEPERIGFARTLVATTDRAFQGVAGQGFGHTLFRTTLLPHLAGFVFGFSPARRLLFRTISQTRIAYHESPLSEGRAGDVRGGDRLPWVAACDNFAPLRDCAWQVHVYGEASPALREEAEALGLALHAFRWDPAADEAGIERDAAYLIRPDGYVALAAPRPEEGVLRRFTDRIGYQPP